MSNSRIEQIIEEIEDYIDSCKGPLFGGGDKIVVDRERVKRASHEDSGGDQTLSEDSGK